MRDRHVGRMGWFRGRGAALLFVAASFWPLHILTVNLFGVVRPERVFGLIVLVWAFGMLMVGVMTFFGVDVEAAENTSFVAIVLFMNGGEILREFDTLAYVILIAVPVLAGWLLVRLKGHFLVTALIWGTAVTLAVGPIITFYESWNARGGPSSVALADLPSVELSETPDIFLVVFDGYPGTIAAKQDGLDVGVVDVSSELRDRGFQVPASSWSSYWITMLSIPSLLQMDYPVVEDSWEGVETTQDLQRIVGGGSVFVKTLQASGYSTHMVESGWSAGSCEPMIDVCVPPPLIDEATYLILKHTAAWALINDSPGPYVLGALAGFDQLLKEAPKLSRSRSPDFVFMHVISPHPPLLLEDDCSVELVYQRMGTVFSVAGVSPELREEYLVDQIDCMDRMMLRLADAVDPEDIVIFVSDHGTDRRGQAHADHVHWNRAATVERLNNFLALRLPEGCAVGDPVVVPNVLRSVVDCLSSSTVEMVPERMWVNPMVELRSDVVNDLLNMGASSS